MNMKLKPANIPKRPPYVAKKTLILLLLLLLLLLILILF